VSFSGSFPRERERERKRERKNTSEKKNFKTHLLLLFSLDLFFQKKHNSFCLFDAPPGSGNSTTVVGASVGGEKKKMAPAPAPAKAVSV
jgi:hypothetical protein